MKKTFEILKNLVVTVYILLIIFVTICLLSYNDYKVTVFGMNTLIPIIDEDLEPDFYVGDLVIAKKGSLARVKEGDEIFFYRTISGETTINYAKVTKTERVNDTEFTYTVEGNHRFSSSYYIGNTKDATVIPVAGKILSLLQSKWGFLFLGVFPSLVAFLYTLHNVITEVQEVKEAERKAKRKKKKKKTVEKNTGKDIVQTEENGADVPYVEEEKEEKNEIDEIQENTEMDSVENDDVVENVEDNGFSKIETTISIERNEKVEEQPQKEDASKNEIKENKEETVKEETVNEENHIEEKEAKIEEPKEKQSAEQKKKALIEAKMKSMTEEEKRALIEAKLKSMTPEEKKALIEAKKKKMEAEKNKKGE